MLKRSLAELNLTYVDLYLIHIPFSYTDNSDELLRQPNVDVVSDLNVNHVAIWKVLTKILLYFVSYKIGFFFLPVYIVEI